MLVPPPATVVLRTSGLPFSFKVVDNSKKGKKKMGRRNPWWQIRDDM